MRLLIEFISKNLRENASQRKDFYDSITTVKQSDRFFRSLCSAMRETYEWFETRNWALHQTLESLRMHNWQQWTVGHM